MKYTNILITGASRGIGYDAVLAFSKNPSCQVFAISRNAEKLEQLKAHCGTDRVHILPFDLSEFDASALDAFLGSIKVVHILVNNAGLLINKSFEELSLQEWQTIFSVNLFGSVQLIKALLPKLEGAKPAHIVNIGSMGGVQGSSKFPGLSAYSASKAALANLTECLAEEFKGRNIIVNCLALGAIQTEMLAEAFPGYKAPLDSETMASYLTWFALNGHKFHNGKIIPLALSTP